MVYLSTQKGDNIMENINEIIEHENGEQDEQDEVAMFQRMINDGSVWHFQGSYGRRAMELLRAGQCELGEKRFKDAYGNVVPSRFDVKAGTMGAPLSTR
jgi:hypothetical protein